MSSRARLFSREHAIEFALVLALGLALARMRDGASVVEEFRFWALVAFEVVCIGVTTRHAWRQFATLEQTEWNLAVGRTSRALLALDYVTTLLWRSSYHAAALFAVNGRVDAAVFAWLFFPRVACASWRHLGGSRIVPWFVRFPLSAPRTGLWRLPAQFAIVACLATGSIYALAAAQFAPWLWWVLAPAMVLVLYALVRTSEPFDTDTEVAMTLPRLRAAKGPLKARWSSGYLGLLWLGSKVWWRWIYLPLLVLAAAVIAFDSTDSANGLPSSWINGAVAVLAAVLVGVVASAQRSLPLRLLFLIVFAALLFIVVNGVPPVLGTVMGSKVLEDPRPGSTAALLIAVASVLAASASPYVWESRGASADNLRLAGIETSRLRRIELATGLALGAIAWIALAATFPWRSSVAFGAAATALCLLLQDRTRYVIGRFVVEPRARLSTATGFVLALVLVFAPSACKQSQITSSTTTAVAALALMIAATAWLVAWRRAAVSATSDRDHQHLERGSARRA